MFARLTTFIRNIAALQRVREEQEAAAYRRSFAFLNDHVTPQQRSDYANFGFFDVLGQSGSRYRIRYGTQMNIERFGADGRYVGSLCFAPKGELPVGDVMLAQKVALESMEKEALDVANRAALLLGGREFDRLLQSRSRG